YEHGLQIEGRSADALEHVGGCGLLLERLPQLIEQPRVLDGDDGLVGETLDQFDLLVGEQPHLLASKCDYPDQLIVLEHWDGKHSPISAEFDTDSHERIALDVGRYRRDVGDVGDLFCGCHKPKRRIRGRSDQRLAPARRGISWRRVVRGNHAEAISVAEIEIAELGLAEPRRVLKQGLKYRLKLAGRAADDTEHL